MQVLLKVEGVSFLCSSGGGGDSKALFKNCHAPAHKGFGLSSFRVVKAGRTARIALNFDPAFPDSFQSVLSRSAEFQALNHDKSSTTESTGGIPLDCKPACQRIGESRG